jgi:iron-sulfur cluster assembly protein
MAITLTESAAKQIKSQLAKRGKGLALRVGIKKVGCSGYAYTYDYADEVLAGDHVCEAHNAKVVFDDSTLAYINGSRLDFVTEGLKQTFKFDNPNVGNMCGCGESFSLSSTAAKPMTQNS